MAEHDVPVGRGDSDSDEEKKRRRRFVFWILFGAAILLVVVLLFVFSGGEEDAPAAAPPTSTAAPTTTAPTTPASTSAPTTQPASTTTEAGPIDVSGVWTFLIDVTEAKGTCSGEEDEKVEPNEVTIRQDGVTLTVTGLNNTDPPWQGEIVANSVTFAGERDEDGGRTIAAFTLTVDDAAATLAGIEVWSWSGPGGGCADARSEVSAVRS